MCTCVEVKEPKGLNDVPEDNVWIHTHILCKEYDGALGLAVYGSKELAQLVFPNWSDSGIRKAFEAVEISFDEAREIAKETTDIDGNFLTAVHVHNTDPLLPSFTHWVK